MGVHRGRKRNAPVCSSMGPHRCKERVLGGELSSERLHAWLSTGHAVKPAVFYNVSIECSVTVNRGKIENSVKNRNRFNFCILLLSLFLFPWFLNSLYVLDFYILMIAFFLFFFLGEKKIGIIENRNRGAL